MATMHTRWSSLTGGGVNDDDEEEDKDKEEEEERAADPLANGDEKEEVGVVLLKKLLEPETQVDSSRLVQGRSAEVVEDKLSAFAKAEEDVVEKAAFEEDEDEDEE